MTPLVSIIMPSLNQAEFITKAIDSVTQQDYKNIELIVVDGLSSDETKNIVESLAVQDSRIRFISEQDTGPASAVNKGIRLSKGTIIGWLNSDDRYIPDAVTRAVDTLSKCNNNIMVYGLANHIDGDDRLIAPYPTCKIVDSSLEQFENGCYICQPTVFFKRALPMLLGPLNEQLKTAFDFEYWIRVYKRFPERIGFVDALQAESRLHDRCITLKQRKTVFLESMKIIAEHIGDPPSEWLVTYATELLSKDPGSTPEQVKNALHDILTSISPYLSEIGRNRLERTIASL